MLRTVACDLCGSDDHKVVLRKRGRAIKREFLIVRCRRCGLVFVNPRLDDQGVENLYDEAYYEGRGFDPSINYCDAGSPTAPPTDSLRQIVESLRSATGDLKTLECLDIGCGTGALVQSLRNEGAAAFGIDSSRVAQMLCKSKGVPLLDGDLDDLAYAGRVFDVVTAIEVIEHVLSPMDFLIKAKGILKPGGVLYITTGNWQLVRLQPGTPYIMPEGHLYYFTPVTLTKYFAASGLTVKPNAFNRSWIVWRLLKAYDRPRFVQRMVKGLGHLTRIALPELAPFPIGSKSKDLD